MAFLFREKSEAWTDGQTDGRVQHLLRPRGRTAL